MATKAKKSKVNYTPLNVEAIKAKKEQIENQAQGKKEENPNFWSPTKPSGDEQEGPEHLIRMVQPEDGDPFKTIYFHFNKHLSNRRIICLKKNYNKKCPICELASEVWNAYVNDGRKNDELKEQAKSLFADRRPRTFSPILVRGEEDKGVRWWGYPPSVYDAFLEDLKDPDVGDITSPFEGYDYKLKVRKTEGKTIPSPFVKAARKPSPLADTEEEMASLLETIPDFDSLFDIYSADELSEMIKEGFGDSDGNVSVESQMENDGQTLDDIANEIKEDDDDLPF